MTSKEALKNIKTLSYCKQHITIQEWCNIIHQDLDRLEKLEYVMLLIVDYGLIDLKPLEKFMNDQELEAMQKAFKEAEDKMDLL